MSDDAAPPAAATGPTLPPAHKLTALLPRAYPDRALCACGESIFPLFDGCHTVTARHDRLLDAHAEHVAQKKETGR